MTETITSDSVRFYRPRLMPCVELVSVCYRERSFPEHSHSEYVVGAVVAGAETLTVAGRSHRVDTGSVLRLHPDEAHANATIGSDVLRYDVLYLREDTIRPYERWPSAIATSARSGPTGLRCVRCTDRRRSPRRRAMTSPPSSTACSPNCTTRTHTAATPPTAPPACPSTTSG